METEHAVPRIEADSPIATWLERLKREGFAPVVVTLGQDGRDRIHAVIECRKQKKGLPGPIPKGVTVLMR